jgi:hypothetical protein
MLEMYLRYTDFYYTHFNDEHLAYAFCVFIWGVFNISTAVYIKSIDGGHFNVILDKMKVWWFLDKLLG